ncbi:MAG: transcription-repair coupling factor [Betaproteobacteria bacterium]|jgi:transcription-repair coupling factor|nr:transcription-repair coupling factor [Betaproteobacteria bacterium]
MNASVITSWRLSQLIQSRPLVVFTRNTAEAQRWQEEIAWFRPDAQLCCLPDWETLAYDRFSPHQDLVSERLATLWLISQGEFDILLVPVTTALYRLPPVSYLAGHTFFLRQGQKLEGDTLIRQMAQAGYQAVQQVIRPGEFCRRGGVLDLFPMGSTLPYRLELFDDRLETLRTFDADTQRSLYPVPELRLLPAREFPLDEAARTRFRSNFRDHFEGDPSRCTLYRDVGNGLSPGGIEYYLPLFFDQCASLFDYLPASSRVFTPADLTIPIREFLTSVRSRWEMVSGDRTYPVLPPDALFLREEAFFVGLKAFVPERPPYDTHSLPALDIQRRSPHPLAKLQQFIDEFPGRILILSDSLGRRETLRQLLNEQGIAPEITQHWAQFETSTARLMLTVAPLQEGLLYHDRLALITENELFQTQVHQRRRRDRRSQSDNLLRDLTEVHIGDPVVHQDHGIGRFMGLVTLDLGEGSGEFMQLTYAGDDTLYLPVAQLHLISRYSGGPPESAPLHKLGSGQWEKARRQAARQARDTAAELLDLYARRAARSGWACPIDDEAYAAFAEGFPFEETPDQLAAIDAVRQDLASPKPMDRLVCGDVGFGKTEVALRAAFLTIQAGRQVALLVPTTLLAEQHFQNFSDRFADWPIKIAELSRFRSAKEMSATLGELENGRVDLVIGTHKLLSKEVRFARLGLVIIDEEHRFGVRQKERLKALRTEVDVLTLTATPIPRTLSLALEGLRDFSVIATAPQKRLAIKTFVRPHSPALIREATLRELKRGGQLYFLYNEVETIENERERLAQLLPEARIAVAHGQMRERELEQVMRDFYQQRSNLLLCSTIIETGIDVPNANTILIHRADRFGLAQLHQLRGRVGRSHHQAYAYLLTPPEEALTPAAKKRLDAIQQMEELGAGFYLAMQDLEIRGAGEVLGDSQSGDIQGIGFNLYTQMLSLAVKTLRQGGHWDPDAPLESSLEINLHAPALLPEDYCGDVQERLILYKRLANCEHTDALNALQEELIDRFGLLPQVTKTLLEVHRLRIHATPLGIRKIDAHETGALIQFVTPPPFDAQAFIQLVQKQRYRLAGSDRLRLVHEAPEPQQRADIIQRFLEQLRSLPAAP